MLILIISAVVMIIGIIMIVCSRVFGPSLFNSDFLWIAGALVVTVTFIILVLASVVAIYTYATKEKDYQNAIYEKQMLEYRLDHIKENLVGSELLYSDITEFNNELRTCKYYVKSPWLGLFYNDKIATIDYIEISELKYDYDIPIDDDLSD